MHNHNANADDVVVRSLPSSSKMRRTKQLMVKEFMVENRMNRSVFLEEKE
jgi:hypothetical protein